MIIGKSLTALGGGCLVASIFVKGLSEYIESNGMQLTQLIGQNTGDF